MEQTKSSSSSWLEGLLLLLVIVAVILFSVCSTPAYSVIMDEKVSTSSSISEDLQIDNLQ